MVFIFAEGFIFCGLEGTVCLSNDSNSLGRYSVMHLKQICHLLLSEMLES